MNDILSPQIKNIKLYCACQFFKNKTHVYQTNNYVFSHTETYYLKYDYLKYGTKHILCFMNTLNVFLQHFLNHNFHIILNNDTINL